MSAARGAFPHDRAGEARIGLAALQAAGARLALDREPAELPLVVDPGGALVGEVLARLLGDARRRLRRVVRLELRLAKICDPARLVARHLALLRPGGQR